MVKKAWILHTVVYRTDQASNILSIKFYVHARTTLLPSLLKAMLQSAVAR